MVKGVNRQIIEIKSTGSEYFERALLFIKNGATIEEREHACEEAKEYIKSLASEKQRRKSRDMRVTIIVLSLGLFIALAAVGVLLFACTKM